MRAIIYAIGVGHLSSSHALAVPNSFRLLSSLPPNLSIYDTSRRVPCRNGVKRSPLRASSSENDGASLGGSGKKRPLIRVVASKGSVLSGGDGLEFSHVTSLRNKRRTSPKSSNLYNKELVQRTTSSDGSNQPTNVQGKYVGAGVKFSSSLVSGAVFQRQEMMEHSLLTKEEELILGRRVVRARELREKIDTLVEARKWERGIKISLEEEEDISLLPEDGHVDMEFLSYELEQLSLYGIRHSSEEEIGLEEYDLEDDLLIDHAMHRSHHLKQLKNGADSSNNNPKTAKRSGYSNGHGNLASTTNNNSYTPLLHIPIHLLSEQDVVSTLGVPGGKAEATELLLDGAHAREMLMRKNVKLVISIAKSWMKNSFSTENPNLGGVVNGHRVGGKGPGNRRNYLSQMYDGSWDRPSLDEAVQEGILGLARAVDKYNPERGLRFSTYATHWVTSYVRICFQRALTGCLRVPSQLHDIKAAYKRIIKDHLQSSETPPAMKSIATELGISEQRLTTAIRATGSLVSVDAPIVSPGSGNFKGSAAGGDGSSSQELVILDTLSCDEPRPEDQVEVSFLRNCLENAMATELTPYERDVLRLRLGLDSGEGKTVREIAEICGGSVKSSEIRAAERRAIKKLRSPSSVHTHNLLAYLDLGLIEDRS